MDITLSVVIVNYNGVKFLENCINSINKSISGDFNYEIIIVDNNSTDESVSIIKKKFPSVVLIESKKNLGFGRGNNLGVEHSKGKYILLLNNDTIILDKINKCIEIIDKDPDIGVLGINMLNGNKNYLQAVGKFPDFLSFLWFKQIFNINKDFKFGNFQKEKYEVDWISGSFMIMRKEIYIAINGFDKDYFMYVEDIDICKKIANRGLKRIFISDINYVHFVGFKFNRNKTLVASYKTYIKKHSKNKFNKIIFNIALGINVIIKIFKNKY